MFRRAVRRGKLAHAYLFLGPPGVGKRRVARGIAQSLTCSAFPAEALDACGTCPACRQIQSGTHPDLMVVGLPEGKRELPVEAFLGPRERRGREGLLHELSLRPMSASRRLAIIDDADRMTEESANALLKTLEEPPAGVILFLIASSSDALLPTIRSRCQPLLFGPLPEDAVASLVVEQEWETDGAAAAEIARLSSGSLETARQLLDPGLRGLRQGIAAALATHPFSPVDAAKQALTAIEDLQGGAAGQRANAGWLVRFSVDFLRQALVADDAANGQIERFRRAYPPDDPAMADRITAALERCLRAEEHLQQSMPAPLCLESLLHDVGRILRGALVAV
jgi:DNA polymerase-3 subunit delta'